MNRCVVDIFFTNLRVVFLPRVTPFPTRLAFARTHQDDSGIELFQRPNPFHTEAKSFVTEIRSHFDGDRKDSRGNQVLRAPWERCDPLPDRRRIRENVDVDADGDVDASSVFHSLQTPHTVFPAAHYSGSIWSLCRSPSPLTDEESRKHTTHYLLHFLPSTL